MRSKICVKSNRRGTTHNCRTLRDPRVAQASRLKRHCQAERYSGTCKGHEPQAIECFCSTSRAWSVQLAQRRVAKRVNNGRHAIAAEVTARRFYRSLANLLQRYRGIAALLMHGL